MTREEMLKFCSVCKNRKMDLKRGLVCSLTDDYADFDPVCENYNQDTEEKHWKSIGKEIDKRERQKEIVGRIIPIVLYFVFLCCLLIPTLSTPIYIIAILNVFVIAVIVVANILYWRKLIQKKSVDGEILTIDKIMDCIRKEGYYPQKLDEENIYFKIQGETYMVKYASPFFQVCKSFRVDENNDLQALYEAASVIMQGMWLIKIFPTIHDDGSKGIVFSVESIVTSSKDFENNNLFSVSIDILHSGISNHTNKCRQIAQEQQKAETPKQKIGFPVNSSSIKN